VEVKATHPDTPLILYIMAVLVLERMARSVDLVVDWTVDMKEAIGCAKDRSTRKTHVLYLVRKEFIRERILDTVRKAGNKGHILNLGHGVYPVPRKM